MTKDFLIGSITEDFLIGFLVGIAIGAPLLMAILFVRVRSLLQEERQRAERLRATMTDRGAMLDTARYVDSVPLVSIEDYHNLRLILSRTSEFWIKAHLNRILFRFEIDQANQAGNGINPLSTDDDRDRADAFVRHMVETNNPKLRAAAERLSTQIARLSPSS